MPGHSTARATTRSATASSSSSRFYSQNESWAAGDGAETGEGDRAVTVRESVPILDPGVVFEPRSEDGIGWGETLPSVSAGFRYPIAPQNNLNLRIDLAWGRGEQQFYVGIGEAF